MSPWGPDIYALKMVRADYGSLTQDRPRIFYRPGERVSAGKNGIYASVSGGLDAAGLGERIALLTDLEGPTGAEAPAGVVCFLSARVVAVVERGEQWETYAAARRAAWRECEAACDPAWRDFAAACDPAWREFAAVCEPARRAYKALRKGSRMVFMSTCYEVLNAAEHDPARQSFQDACKPAHLAFEAACEPAQRAFNAALAEAWLRLLADVVAEAGWVEDGKP